MPTSYGFFKPEIKQWFLDNVPRHKRILDVGPGEGTYSNLLRSEGYRMDAIEIYEPYVDRYNLREKYDNVYIGDIVNFDVSDYDFIILGDVLEHLSKDAAYALIDKIDIMDKKCLVAVPYSMPQGEHEGNPHEAHLQEDLTPQVMSDRYPELVCLYKNDWYGYYAFPDNRLDKAFVLYCTKSYRNTVQGAVDSIRAFSDIPIIVYLLNYYAEIEGATVETWECDAEDVEQQEFISRTDKRIYNILIQRPRIVMHALKHYAKTVAYVDADSVATANVEKIFDLAKDAKQYPYFTRGIYDYLYSNGRGGTEFKKTLEYPACNLFNVAPDNRLSYRQTGYFVANEHSVPFLEEWSWMCNHPEILRNPQWYAPFHEETILNVMLWNYRISDGLPLVYMNIRGNIYDRFAKDPQWGTEPEMWVKYPDREEHLLFYHGEKNREVMHEMMAKIKEKYMKDYNLGWDKPEEKKDVLDLIEGPKPNLRVLFVAPHLSTGGMPAFLLKRIESLLAYTNIDIYVVEFKNYSPDFVVQKNKIMKLVKNFWTLGDDKTELIKIIKDNQIDVVHVDEMVEGFDDFNRIPKDVLDALYAPNRTWRMIETNHNISFNPDTQKLYHPDAYAFCTPFHLETFKNMKSLKKVIQFPIDNKKPSLAKKIKAQHALGWDPAKRHVLNVGLWTPGKNQAEGLEIARKYPQIMFHFVGNQAGNFQHYWQPLMNQLPENVKIWGERNDVFTFYTAADLFMFNSTWECNPLALREAISYELPIIARNLPQYVGMYDPCILPIDSDLLKEDIWTPIYEIPMDNESEDFARAHEELYKEVCNLKVTSERITTKPLVNTPVEVARHYVGQPFFQLNNGVPGVEYDIAFYDEKGRLGHQQKGTVGTWIKLNRKWFTRWRTVVSLDGQVVYDETLNFEGKRIFVVLGSEALGDTLAWIPYCEEFQKKHNCQLIVCTFHNKLFKDAYPEIEFVEPGQTVNNIHAQYYIGSHNEHDPSNEPQNTINIPLQKVAANILGLEYEEIQPRVSFKKLKRTYKNRYVAIATNSTAGCKFWQKEDWQKVIDWLVEQGYQVINISKERNDFHNCTQILNDSMNNTMNVLAHAEFYIGLSSGLSWLAWAMEKKVVMIANFTSRDYEFDCIRLTNESVCHGCFNNPNFRFDRTWDWCPIFKGQPNQWICQRSITADMVIEEIKKELL